MKLEEQLSTFAFYDFVEWTDESSQIPSQRYNKYIKSMWWNKSEKIPHKNESRVVFITSPVAKKLKINSEFWCLYSPASSAINGFDCHPEEIKQSGFFLCTIKECLEEVNEGKWFIVSVTKTKTFAESFDVIKPVHEQESVLSKIGLLDRYILAQSKDWLYFCGDRGEYIGHDFFIKVNDGKYHLVCFTEWTFDIFSNENSAYAWYGNLILSEETVRQLKSSVNYYL